jgi:2-polyprenyl-6-methoxyphenol hydroxylase-like FAD-dependent oxidoreductase
LLADGLADIGLDRELMGPVAEGHERAAERVAVDGSAHLDQTADAEALSSALARYTAARLPRTTDVVRWSRRAGQMSTWTSRPGVAVRDTTARVLGKIAPGALLRGLAPIYDWRPGEGD